jgi:hypothetical protein
MPEKCLRFYSPTYRGFELELLIKRLSDLLDGNYLPDIDEESCFYVIVKDAEYANELLENQSENLGWLFSHDVFAPKLSKVSKFKTSDFVVEVGPR